MTYDFNRIKAVEKNPYYRMLESSVFKLIETYHVPLYLEIGCYFGYRLNKFATRLPESVFLGLDIGYRNLLFGKQKIIISPNVFLINADAGALPFKDNSMKTIFTFVSLTHIDYGSINRVMDEIVRVCGEKLLLLEVDHRPMNIIRRIQMFKWHYGYFHPYEKIIDGKMDLLNITPFPDAQNHPRYTVFEFAKY